jgi:surface protein
MEKNPYEKNKYLEKHQYLNVSQAELERKWRLYEEEQEAMKILMGISAPGNAYSVPFISTWKTDNLSTGSSNSNQVKLPLIPDGSYNFYVNWGDGTVSSIAAWNQPEVTHTYAAIGTYTISITGYIRGWDWGTGTTSATPTTGDRLKILTITQWGCLRFVDKGDGNGGTLIWGAFYNCSNLTLLTVVDTPNFEGTTSTLGMFRGCSAITTINNINRWNVSNIQIFRNMFREMALFDDNVGNWDTSNATNFVSVFTGTSATSPGKFNNGGSSSINNWNTSKVTSMNAMFAFQPSFNQNIGAWDVSKVTDMTNMFRGTTVAPYGTFNNGGSDSIKNWNTSSVTIFNSMFSGQINFNQEVGLWNISSATTATFMFSISGTGVPSGKFNNGGSPSINNWNTSNITSLRAMFQGQPLFNQPIGNWNISNVTDISFLFVIPTAMGTGTFNQDVGSWNTSNVTDISNMFSNQANFNQNIGAWNTSKVTNMSSMFLVQLSPYGVFNNGGNDSIKNWDTSNVTNMSAFISGQNSFNQPIGSWNTSKVTNMDFLFYAYTSGTSSFNQNISSWDTSKVTSMNQMFLRATSFNQPIGTWNVSLVTNFTNFMFGKTFNDYSTANYDALLIGWASRPVQAGRSINFGTIKYTAAASAARLILTSAPNNWTIVDGGL